MKYVKPIDINVISTNVLENDYPEWSNATTYALGDSVIVAAQHRIYKSVQASNLSHDPVSDDGTWWVDMGATNAYCFADEFLNTQTENADSIVIELAASKVTTVALFGLSGNSVTVKTKNSGGTVVDTQTFTLASRVVSSWYEFFFEEFIFTEKLIVLTPIEIGGSMEITVESTGGTAKLGKVAMGFVRDLGATLWKPRTGIIDFSRQTTDEFGRTSLAQGVYKDTADLNVVLDTSMYDIVAGRLKEIRSRECLFIGDGNYEGLIIYGFVKSWSLVLEGLSKSELSIKLEGLS